MLNYAGCTLYWSAVNFPIVVSVEDTIPKADIPFIQEALDNWNSKLGRKVFVLDTEFLWYHPNSPGIAIMYSPLRDNLLGFCPIKLDNSINGIYGEIWRGVCLIDRDKMLSKTKVLMKEKLVNTITHELGHALGFGHDEDNLYSIMYPVLNSTTFFILEKHVVTIDAMMNDAYKRSVGNHKECL